MGPGKTVSSELFVDGVRRPDEPKSLRPSELEDEGPDDDRLPVAGGRSPTLRLAA
jgi:hypothetical protein